MINLKDLLENQSNNYTPRKYKFFQLNKDGTRRRYIVFLWHPNQDTLVQENYFPFEEGSKRPIKCEGNPFDQSSMASCERCLENKSPSCSTGDETKPKYGILVYDLTEEDPEDGIKLWEASSAVLKQVLEIQKDHKIEESVCVVSRDQTTRWFIINYVDSIDDSDRVTDEHYDVLKHGLVGSGAERTITITDAYSEEDLARLTSHQRPTTGAARINKSNQRLM